MQLHIDSAGRAKSAWSGKTHSALQGLMIDPGKVYGSALAGFGAVNAFAAGLDTSHPQFQSGGKEFDFVFR